MGCINHQQMGWFIIVLPTLDTTCLFRMSAMHTRDEAKYTATA